MAKTGDMIVASVSPCRFRIDNGKSAWGLCRVGEDELGTNRFSRCHLALCQRCTKAGDETKNTQTPNAYLASVLVDAASTGSAQTRPTQHVTILDMLATRWKQFLKVVTPTAKEGATEIKAKRPNRCEHRGKVTDRMNCNCPRLHVYECRKYKDEAGTLLQIVPARQCEVCHGYEDSEEEN